VHFHVNKFAVILTGFVDTPMIPHDPSSSVNTQSAGNRLPRRDHDSAAALTESVSGNPRTLGAIASFKLALALSCQALCGTLSFVLDYSGANGLAERSVSRILFQPRTERTSPRPCGPGRSFGEILASALGARAKFRVSTERTAQDQRPDRGESRKIVGGVAWAY
jgi:hypothetical protein